MVLSPVCHLFSPRSHMLNVCFWDQNFSAFLEVRSRFIRCSLVVNVISSTVPLGFNGISFFMYRVSYDFLRFCIRLGLFYNGEVSEDRAAFAVSVFHLLGDFFKAISFPAQLRYTARQLSDTKMLYSLKGGYTTVSMDVLKNALRLSHRASPFLRSHR